MIAYAITDPRYYGSDGAEFRGRVAELLDRGAADWIVLRDKGNSAYPSLARDFIALSSRYEGVRFLLHGDWRLAADLGAWGVHLPGNAVDQVPYAVAAGLKTVVSTHSLREAQRAQALGAYAVTVSPVFKSPGKGEPLGLEKLKEIRDRISILMIALGGIVTARQIEAVARCGADGFASIRYFANYLQGNDDT